MNKTRVDDMLIEMITPKIKEIEEKFSQGTGLNSEDINTLLLKSQYNHINHLDTKLDEAVADVASLKSEFSSLKGEFTGLKGGFSSLKGEFTGLKGEFTDLKEEFSSLKGEFTGLKGEFIDLKGEFSSLKGDFELLRVDLYSRFDNLEQKIESNIQKALNKNMMQLIIVLGAFATVFKMLDIFTK